LLQRLFVDNPVDHKLRSHEGNDAYLAREGAVYSFSFYSETIT